VSGLQAKARLEVQ